MSTLADFPDVVLCAVGSAPCGPFLVWRLPYQEESRFFAMVTRDDPPFRHPERPGLVAVRAEFIGHAIDQAGLWAELEVTFAPSQADDVRLEEDQAEADPGQKIRFREFL